MEESNIKQILITLLCVIAAVFGVAVISRAVTTISTNIMTGGNLGVGTTTTSAALEVYQSGY